MAKKYEIEVGLLTKLKTDTGSLQTEVGKIQQAFKKLDLGEATNKKLENLTNNLTKELGKFDAKIQKGNFANKSELTSFEKTASTISTLYKQLENEINNIDNDALKKLLPKNASQKVNAVNDAFAKFVKVQKEGKKASSGLQNEVEKTSRILETASGKVKTKRNKVDEVYAALKLPSPKDIDKELKQVEQKLATAQGQLEAKKIKGRKEGTLVTGQNDRVLKSSTTEGAYALQVEVDSLKKRQAALKALKDAETAAATASTKHAAAIEAQSSSTAETQKAFTELTNALAILKNDNSYRTLEQTDANVERLAQEINNLNEKELQKLKGAVPTEELEQMGNVLNQVEKETDEAASAFDTFASKEQEIDQLKNSFMSFFSIANVVQLLKSAVRAAFDSIQELDKAMTETAVVTDFSVGDMWEQLPRYTKTANELGVTTLGAYETMTLFYQQGLDTNEAFELGTETMKMARIAGLDYAEATDKMTAALRGFNMELNTLSAQRVSDVYSELAAITAADTDEISTAMTKTASIANSANMEFETTAAFLSQIIETTRESAETAGTALKTVIARFQELKKDPAEIGEVDGEVVDANKIETALRSVGVALRDTNGQFRDLDDVFLELSEKWDTLNVNTQRYVATIAAGSRQQSRFIAMMSDYGRTVELVNAAYGSAGAAQKQYEKTLESWESKIAQLKNAWQEFVLGIVDSDFAKFIIDTGTTALNILNKLTEGVGGLSTTFLRLGVVIGGLKLGKVLLPALGSGLLDKSKPLGVGLGKSIKEGLQVEFSGNRTRKLWASLFANPSKMADNVVQSYRKALVTNANQIALMPEGADRLARTKEFNKQSILYGKILRANQANVIAFNNARKAGVSVEQAELLLGSQNLEQTAAEIAATMTENAAEQAEIKTKILNNTVQKEGILVRIKNIVLKARDTVQTWLQAKANRAEGTSRLFANAAILAGVAAIGLLIFGMVKFIKYAKDNTLEKRMERAAEATKKTQEAANAAKDAYNELNNTLKSLGEHENELDTLIEGTDAWREKVAEINSEFTKLIDLYPDLQKFIKFDTEKGIYQWTDNGQAAQNYLESANIEMAERQYEVSNNRERERDLQLAKEISAFSFSAYVSTYGTIGEGGYQEGAVFETQTLNLTTDQAKKIAEALQGTGGRATDSTELLNILSTALPNINGNLLAALVNDDKSLSALYELTDSITGSFVDNRPQAEAYVSTLLSNNEAYTNIKDSDLKKYIVATAVNKTEEEGFANKYTSANDVIDAYQTRNKTSLDTTHGVGKYTIEVKDGQIQVQDLDGNLLHSAGTVEQVGKQLSIEDYVTGELDIAAQTTQFNNEVAYALEKLYKIEDPKRATSDQLQNAQKVVTTAAINNVNKTDNEQKYFATGLGGLTFDELNNIIQNNDEISDIVVAAKKAYEIKQQTNVDETAKWLSTQLVDQNQSGAHTAASELEMSNAALELYTQHIVENNEKLKDNAMATNLVVQENLELEKSFKDIIPIIEEEEEALANIGSPDYYKAVDKIFKSLNGLLDLNNLTAADLTPEHLALIKEAAGGSEEALIKLRKEMALISLQKMDLPAEDLNDLTTILQGLDGFNVEAGMTFDDTEVLTKLTNLVEQGKMSVTELNGLLSNTGYQFQVTGYDEIPAGEASWASLEGNFIEKAWAKLTNKTVKVPRMGLVATGDASTTGLDNAVTSSSSSSGGSSDSGNDYDADYDKYYNKMEDLAEEQRVRNRLEEDYNKLLKDNNSTISEMVENLDKQIASLEREREIQEFLYDARRQQIRDLMSEYSDLQGYALYNFNDNTVEINYDAIRAITDEEVGSRIDEYISKLEEFQDQMDEANDALAEIEEQIIEALEKGKEEYFSLEERAMDALVHSYEQEIDELNRINDSINDANSELLNSINSTLERQRREEENAEKEQELSDMQRRLDYLRQDTSGANALEIKQLEKELAEAQDDYTDSLIDQKISELEEQNDKAAEQREKQIAFAEAQLEAAQKTGALWDEIHKMFDTDIDENGIKTDSKLYQLLMAAEEVPSKSDLERNKWLADLHKEVVQGFSWLKDKNDVSDLITTGELSEGQTIKFTDAKGQEYNGIINKDGSVTANDAIFRNVKRDQYGNYSTTESYDDAKRKAQSHNWQEQKTPANNTPVLTEDIKRGVSAAIWNGNYGWGDGDTRSANLREVFGENDIQENYVNDYVQSGYSGNLSDYSYTAMRYKFKKYKTGGLADFTGPAWLDGTKSRPELVLNQRDTQNFIQLRNVLAEATKSGFGKSEKNEAVMFDIDINIDKVENEENVDALLTELERRINSYASYRNVTALTLKR